MLTAGKTASYNSQEKLMQYKTTKIVNAIPMTRLEYNEFRGWEVPDDENGSDDGFLIETIGGFKNTQTYKGFVQWLPTTQFEAEYLNISKLNFSSALSALKQGLLVARNGWNGKGMHIRLVNNLIYHPTDLSTTEKLEPAFVILNGNVLNTWIPSVSDLLADDWYIVEK